MDVPAVFQDRREDSPTFGAVAVKLPDNSSLGDYGAMTLDRGGSFPRAQRIEGWTLMAATDLTAPIVED